MLPGQAASAEPYDAAATTRSEVELLLCCARTTLGPSTASRIATLVQQGIDWDRFRFMAFRQGVGPLVGRTLRQNPEGVPDTVLEEWHSHVRSSARRSFLLAGRLLRLLTSLRTAGIRAIPFKGPALAVHAYGDLTLRPFVDIDVLVHKRDVAEATAVLSRLGYRQRWRHPWEIEFQDESGISVDLHWAIAPSYDPTPQTFDQLWTRVVPVSLLGAEVATLAPEDLLLVLSIQLAKDWRESRQRLLQICDTAELLRCHRNLQWERVFSWAHAAGGERILLLDLLVAHELLDAPLTEAVLRGARGNPTVRALAGELEARMFPAAAGTERRLKDIGLPSDSSALYVRSRERVRDKLRYFWLRAGDRIRLTVYPSQSDRAFLPLPAGLGFLYYFVRPARVLSRWIRTGRMSSNTERGSSAPS
jgi:hypothetical protein